MTQTLKKAIVEGETKISFSYWTEVRSLERLRTHTVQNIPYEVPFYQLVQFMFTKRLRLELDTWKAYEDRDVSSVVLVSLLSNKDSTRKPNSIAEAVQKTMGKLEPTLFLYQGTIPLNI